MQGSHSASLLNLQHCLQERDRCNLVSLFFNIDLSGENLNHYNSERIVGDVFNRGI